MTGHARQRRAQRQRELDDAHRRNRVEREHRMDEIAQRHDLAACEVDGCELCAEYYALLLESYRWP